MKAMSKFCGNLDFRGADVDISFNLILEIGDADLGGGMELK